MSRLFLRLILVAGAGMTAAACQGDSYGTPSGYSGSITVWLCAASVELQPDGRPSLYDGSRDEPRPERVSRRRRSAAGRLRKPVLRRLPHPHRPSVLIACARSFEPRIRLASAPASLAPECK